MVKKNSRHGCYCVNKVSDAIKQETTHIFTNKLTALIVKNVTIKLQTIVMANLLTTKYHDLTFCKLLYRIIIILTGINARGCNDRGVKLLFLINNTRFYDNITNYDHLTLLFEFLTLLLVTTNFITDFSLL